MHQHCSMDFCRIKKKDLMNKRRETDSWKKRKIVVLKENVQKVFYKESEFVSPDLRTVKKNCKVLMWAGGTKFYKVIGWQQGNGKQ